MPVYHSKMEKLKDERDEARRRVYELEALINNPHTVDFLQAVRLEAAHQRERWGADHDAGKADSDWFWLIGYVCGKAISKPEKQLHHIITTAAVCLNWHMARTVGNTMRPGIAQSKTSGTAPSAEIAAGSAEAGHLCPHGFVRAENICGPCSEGHPNSFASDAAGDEK